MVTITWRGSFDAAHAIPGHAKCGALHGHTYRVTITLFGMPNPVTGMLADFGDLKILVNAFDHTRIHLGMIDGQEIPPTVENLAVRIADDIHSAASKSTTWGSVDKITVSVQEGDGGEAQVRKGRIL